MPRNLQRIALFGLVFALILAGWSVVGIIVRLSGSPRLEGAGTLRALVASLVLCGVAVWPSVVIYRRLREIHARREVWAWIAAHATWAAPIGSLALMRML